jgi:hypothetical protein
MLLVDLRIVRLFGEQGIRKHARGGRSGALILIEIVLALGALNDLMGALSEMQLGATAEPADGA